MNKKIECNDCKKKYRARNVVKFKGKYLCKNCKTKLTTYKIQQSACTIGRGNIKLEDALKRTYQAKLYGKGYTAQLSLPLCLAEKEFKIVLIEHGKKNKI